jgi:uncharacterized repeat protein (TIGR01451 family)
MRAKEPGLGRAATRGGSATGRLRRASRFVLAGVTAFFVAIAASAVSAKSVYVIANINASPTPIETYNINPDGTITFQERAGVPALAGGAVGIAIDTDAEILFITYEVSNVVQLVDARTFEVLGQATAPGAVNLAGIAVDQEQSLVYTVDRNSPTLYVYEWDPDTVTLALVAGFPINLPDAISLYGIALDETNDLLYVSDAAFTPSNSAVRFYDTATWTKQGEFTVSHQPTGIAVDPVRGFVYTGGAFFGSNLLSKYDLNTATETTQSVAAGSFDGVQGVAVDFATGLVYATRGFDSAGDDLTVWDTSTTPFTLVDETARLGDVTGVAVPADEVSFNPLNLSKDDGLDEELGECAGSGLDLTYDICFDNELNENDVNNVTLSDVLPAETNFVSASDGGTVGETGTVEWSLGTIAAGTTQQCVQLTVEVLAEPESTITNTVTIDSDDTAATTTSRATLVCEVVAQADLSVSGGLDATEVQIGNTVTFSAIVSNAGPDGATGVLVEAAVPEGTSFVSADPSQGTCEEVDGLVSCDLGDIDVEGSATVDITVTAVSEGPTSFEVSVTATQADPDSTNSSVTADFVITSAVPVVVAGEGGAGSIGLLELLILLGALGASTRMRRARGALSVLVPVLALGTVLLTAPPQVSADDTGFYLGASVGASKGNFSAGDLSNRLANQGYTIDNPDVDDSDTGWKVFGGYAFTRYFGVEAAYVDLGNIKTQFGATVNDVDQLLADTARVHPYMAKGFTGSGVGRYPFTDRFAVFGKVGFFIWDAESEVSVVSGGTGTASADAEGLGLAYGVGLEFQIYEGFGLRGEWEGFELDEEESANLLSIGVNYRF